MPDCINLKERFGRKYRVRYEESYHAEHGRGAYADDPWLQIIPCDRGEIYPHGGQTLAASTLSRGPTSRRLAALPCCRMHQDGSDGVTVLFDVADFEAVAEVMRPKRRRILSPEQRERVSALARANLSKLNAGKGTAAHKTAV